MNCKHEKIKSVNCKIFCLYCGEELPIDYIIGKKKIEQQNTQENGENPPENAPEEQQTDEQTSAPAEAVKTPENAAEPVQTDNKPSEPEKAAETPEKAAKTANKTKARNTGRKGK